MAAKPVVKKKSTAKTSTTGAKKPTVKKSTGAKKATVKKGSSTAKTNATKNLKKPDGNKFASDASEAKSGEKTAVETKKGTSVPKTPAPSKTTKSTQRVQSINWPVDEDGQPMAQISFTASDLIPTGKFANVTVGPVTITKFVVDGDGDHLSAELNDLAETVELKVLSEQREIVHAGLKAGTVDED